MDQLKISPSDLTFLWEECKRCFYLKIVHNISRPSPPMPKIFIKIDLIMKAFFADKPTSEISALLPDGTVKYGERWVKSQPIVLPNRNISCYIRGKFDTVIEFSDGSFGVVDFKTAEAKAENIPFYSRQLHAYAYALEHPSPESLLLTPVSHLGLLCFEPFEMSKINSNQVAYLGHITWQECPRDENAFLAFIDQVLSTLEMPHPPAASQQCPWCNYREITRNNCI